MASYKATTPTSKAIVGTLENMYGTAGVDSLVFDSNGRLTPEYGGYTEVDWNSQTQVLDLYGKTIYVDETGQHWSEDDLTLTPIRDEKKNTSPRQATNSPQEGV
jgi:hypothetical protein